MQHMVWTKDLGEDSLVLNRAGIIFMWVDMWHLWVGRALRIIQGGIAEKTLVTSYRIPGWFVHPFLVFFIKIKLFFSAYRSLQFNSVIMLGNSFEGHDFLEVILKVAFKPLRLFLLYHWLLCILLLIGLGSFWLRFSQVNKGKISGFFNLNWFWPREAFDRFYKVWKRTLFKF